MSEVNDLAVNKNKKLSLGKKIFNSGLRIIIGGGLLVYVIIKVNPKEIFYAVASANLFFILIALFLLVPNILIQFLKWKLTCRIFLNEDNNRKIIVSLFHGLSGGTFTPVRIGEYFGRAIEFKEHSFIKISLATFIDKLFPLLVLGFFGSLFSILFFIIYYRLTLSVSLALALLVMVIYYLIFLYLLNKKFRESALLKNFETKIKPDSVWANLKMLKIIDGKFSVMMVSFSIIFYLCVLVQFTFLISAFTHNFNFLNYMWAGNLVMFAKSLVPSISFADLGVRESASVYFLTKMGESSAAAFNASLFLFFINVLLPSIIGVVFLFKRSR